MTTKSNKQTPIHFFLNREKDQNILRRPIVAQDVLAKAKTLQRYRKFQGRG